jgi:hypothetical protein
MIVKLTMPVRLHRDAAALCEKENLVLSQLLRSCIRAVIEAPEDAGTWHTIVVTMNRSGVTSDIPTTGVTFSITDTEWGEYQSICARRGLDHSDTLRKALAEVVLASLRLARDRYWIPRREDRFAQVLKHGSMYLTQ